MKGQCAVMWINTQRASELQKIVKRPKEEKSKWLEGMDKKFKYLKELEFGES